MHRLGHEEQYQGNEDRGHRRAKIEHRAPVVGRQQTLHDNTAEYSADRVTDRHDRHTQILTLRVRELRRDRVDTRQDASNPEPGEYAPSRKIDDSSRTSGHEHADGHEHEAAERSG